VSASRDVTTLVEALRRPLMYAARDGFRGIDRITDLGATLRAACDRLCGATLPPERVGPVRAWRRGLDRFEKMARGDQEIEVARGLRLCLVIGGPATAPLPPEPEPAPVAEKPAPTSPLTAPITTIPGVGPVFARAFAERGIETVEDLAWLVPRRYDDLRHVIGLSEAIAAGESERVTLAGEIVRVSFTRWRRRFLTVVFKDPEDREAMLTVRWFSVHGGMAKRFVVGRRAVISGRLRQRNGDWEMANPDVLGDADDESQLATRAVIRPRYAEIEGVPPAIVRKACRAAIARAARHIADGVPEAIARRMGLPSLPDALGKLHAPPDELDDPAVAALLEGGSDWHRRLAFDELFFLGLAVARRKQARKQDRAAPCVAPAARAEAERALPFRLTSAQRRAIDEVERDLAASEPMSRLLQGDVGAGKTAVAFAAAHVALSAGKQVAIMAPTELLAEQHLRTLEPWLRSLGHRVALLTASSLGRASARESTLAMLAGGAIGVAVGTHALLAERVAFHDLGLVIIDEQHRFGVAQRVRLRTKGEGGEGAPHLLVMTATPIPRTLTLTAYGDLDVSVLDELPPGRTPPDTRLLCGAAARRKAYELVRREVKAGARAFVVCPLVEPSESTEEDGKPWASATATAEELRDVLSPHRVGLVHGRMAAPERDAAMNALRDGAIDVLVATTVIEVGVDVPAARVMVVEDADRFGLAQLHQLRGRVGRGGGGSHCLLLAKGAKTAEASRRLAIMEETCDGFRIAEEDLAIRGPGEVFGAKQAGLPKLRFGDLVAHAALVREARAEADRLLAADPSLDAPEHRVTKIVLEERVTVGRAFGAEGG
jgi:ATP-dependent DNA helicase RecG